MPSGAKEGYGDVMKDFEPVIGVLGRCFCKYRLVVGIKSAKECQYKVPI